MKLELDEMPMLVSSLDLTLARLVTLTTQLELTFLLVSITSEFETTREPLTSLTSQSIHSWSNNKAHENSQHGQQIGHNCLKTPLTGLIAWTLAASSTRSLATYTLRSPLLPFCAAAYPGAHGQATVVHLPDSSLDVLGARFFLLTATGLVTTVTAGTGRLVTD
jgi:hypothetical protein